MTSDVAMLVMVWIAGFTLSFAVTHYFLERGRR